LYPRPFGKQRCDFCETAKTRLFEKNTIVSNAQLASDANIYPSLAVAAGYQVSQHAECGEEIAVALLDVCGLDRPLEHAHLVGLVEALQAAGALPHNVFPLSRAGAALVGEESRYLGGKVGVRRPVLDEYTPIEFDQVDWMHR
jgi:hypothetical protein